MKVDAIVSLGAVCRAMGVDQIDGATVKTVSINVTYRRDGIDGIVGFRRKGGDRLTIRKAEVDEEDVRSEEAKNRRCAVCGDELDSRIDSRDLADFVDYCLIGDRAGALALVHRLFSHEPHAALAAEQHLVTGGVASRRRGGLAL